MRVGTVPQLASAFQPRPGLREQIDQAHTGHTTVVLAGGGGVGKSQMTVACAHQALAAGTELVVWVNAAETEQVITGYARAAHRVQAPGAVGQDAETDAQAFLDWLAATCRSWLLVLDDLTDLDSIAPWWPPPSPARGGRVLATTRRRDALLSGGGRAIVEVDAYTPDEAITYLSQRFIGADMAHLLDEQAQDLVRELGYLPLALAHAAAYMINEAVSCARYLPLLTDRQVHLERLLPRQADSEGYGRHIVAALLLALDAAQRVDPVGLAAPALRLAAHLDPAGHPDELWADAAVTGYLTAHRALPTTPPATAPAAAEPTEVTAEQAQAAVQLLHRYGLITCEARGGSRAVRLHALTARAAREGTPAPEIPAVVQAVADGLASLWPEADHTNPDLCAVLRANTDTLAAHAGDLLWQPDGHWVLYRAGLSLVNTGLYAAALTHWHRLATDSERLLGDEHPDTLTAAANLALCYSVAGRATEAISLRERVLADSERLLGDEHPDTLTARHGLAHSYMVAGRFTEAITLLEQVLAGRERLLGDEHPRTLSARAHLAHCYAAAERATEAITLLERVAADSERLLGEHPLTLAAGESLALSYSLAGRLTETITLLERVLAGRERLLGDEHPETLTARHSLAHSYSLAGRHTEEIPLLERVLADSERLLGDEHPLTLTARHSLAHSYSLAGRHTEEIPLLERVLADSERLLGDEHPDTLTARKILTHSYSLAGRHTEEISLLERVLADSERLLGDEHPDTLTARKILALSYGAVERTPEAIPLLERVAADYERLLGDEHPDTLIVWEGLALSYSLAGRLTEAITLQERVAADYERLLGDEHPDTLTARANLAFSYSLAGRLTEAITLQERVAADYERLLGDEHPDTMMAVDTLHEWRRAQKPRWWLFIKTWFGRR
ncbi:tetratricopeptide repeat protein [Streptomyces maoxianensis]|uniref:Tetratricopeptide repeat protein n=2 Tax=Streptomyces maoxianensis TaxID=1459942 RepID=A0ABV9GEF7_9ACTN